MDYYHYLIGGNTGDFSGLWSPGPGKREDIAIYASFTVKEILVAGVGAYYTKADSVYNVQLFFPMVPMPIGGLSTVRFFYIFGAKYDIPILSSIFLPVGLYVPQSYGDRYAPIFFRAGIGIHL